jgi:hypothetical protein
VPADPEASATLITSNLPTILTRFPTALLLAIAHPSRYPSFAPTGTHLTLRSLRKDPIGYSDHTTAGCGCIWWARKHVAVVRLFRSPHLARRTPPKVTYIRAKMQHELARGRGFEGRRGLAIQRDIRVQRRCA